MTDQEMLQAITALIEPIRSDIADLKSKVDGIEINVQTLNEKIANIDRIEFNMQTLSDKIANIDRIEFNVQTLNDKITNIDLKIENQLDKCINVLGDGHKGLQEKMTAIQRAENRIEAVEIDSIVNRREIEKVKEYIAELKKSS